MRSTEEILRLASEDGGIDVAEWPRVLETVLQRLHDIVHNDFPKPSIPLPAPLPSSIDPEVVASTPPQVPAAQLEQNSQSSTKENDEPSENATRPPVPGFDETPSRSEAVQAPDSVETQEGTLPPDLLSLYQASTRVLENQFAHSPPYTIQRLAELVLEPKKHYRFLPSYLRALDRVVSVSSPVSDFPLPILHANSSGGFLTNGDASAASGITERDTLGSDESLGGALLTPIPWLRENSLNKHDGQGQEGGELHSESTETIQGPNGAGTIETVSATVNRMPSNNPANFSPIQQQVNASPSLSEQPDASLSAPPTDADAALRQQGAVTQGELLRQEQEAGIVPISQPIPRRNLISGGAVAVGREPAGGSAAAAAATREEDEVQEDVMMEERPPEETPHARGPEVIGMEDMGPQSQPLGERGLDMEAAVGRGKSPPEEGGGAATQQSLGVEAPPAPKAEEEANQAEKEGRVGEKGAEPHDREMDKEKEQEETNEKKEKEAKDSDGDMVVADADGRAVGEGGGDH